MKVLLIVLGLALAALAAVLIRAAFKPSLFHIERSTLIEAPPEKIFALIADFRRWDAWSPYLKDPAMVKTYSGPAQGPGATYEWSGNKDVGQGRMEILSVDAPARLKLRLTMIKPFPAENAVIFTLAPQGEATKVSWILDGANPYFVKVMSTFFDFDKMVGGDFEIGLAKLKAAAER